MADEAEERAAAEEAATKKAAEEVAKAGEKKYTQAQVDELLSTQKSKVRTLANEIEEIKKGRGEELAKYEKIIGDTVEQMSKDIPKPILKLLAAQSPAEQWQYLNDPENEIVFEKKQFPLPKNKVAKGTPEFQPHKIDNPF